MIRRALLCIALLAGARCGYEVVQLDEAQADPESEIIVLGDVPQAAIDRLASSTGGKLDDKRLHWTYPDEDTAVPANVAPLTLQWQPAAMPAPKPGMKPGPMSAGPTDATATQTEVYEVRLGAGPGSLRVYTLEPRLTLPSDRWTALLASHVDGTIVCGLRSLTATKKGDLWDGGARVLHVRAALGVEALYFESSMGTMRARVDEATAAPLVYPDASPHCQTGLAIAPDARKLASACSDAQGGVWTLPSLSLTRAIAPEAPGAGGPAPAASEAPTFDPTGSLLVQARADRLVLVDADSGALRGEILGVRAAQPDWSPDGSSIAFAWFTEPPSMPGPMSEAQGSSIARVVRRDDGSFGPPELLAAAGGALGKTLRAPRHAPGGDWLVFEATDERSDEGKDARLFVMRAAGGVPVAVRGEASMGAKNEPRAVGSLPTWLPGDRPDRLWLSYASVRDVGANKLEPKVRQIWLLAVDLLPEEPGIGQRQAAFWLPSQPLAADNRRLLFMR